MGAWGAGILQNDTTADIWSEFKQLYGEGLTPKQIRIKLEKEYRPSTGNEYYSEVWSGIAYGQWMCSAIEARTIEKLKLATDPKNLVLWSEEPALFKSRIKAIQALLQKVQKPRPRSIKRSKVVHRPAYFRKGDVIAIKLNEEQFLVAFVIGHYQNPAFGINEIVFTDLVYDKKVPSKSEILNAEVLYLDVGGRNNYYRGYFWAQCNAQNMFRKIKGTKRIGRISFKNFLSVGQGIPIGDWNSIPALYEEQQQLLNVRKSEKPYRVTIQNVIKPTKTMHAKLLDWSKKLTYDYLKKYREQQEKI